MLMYQSCAVCTKFAAGTLGGLAMPSEYFELMYLHNLIMDMKSIGLDCLGHVIRIVQRRVIRILRDSRAEVRLKVGRPGLKWLGDVENDMRELKVKRWRHKANIREE
jgi:hypothetical protein